MLGNPKNGFVGYKGIFMKIRKKISFAAKLSATLIVGSSLYLQSQDTIVLNPEKSASNPLIQCLASQSNYKSDDQLLTTKIFHNSSNEFSKYKSISKFIKSIEYLSEQQKLDKTFDFVRYLLDKTDFFEKNDLPSACVGSTTLAGEILSKVGYHDKIYWMNVIDNIDLLPETHAALIVERDDGEFICFDVSMFLKNKENDFPIISNINEKVDLVKNGNIVNCTTRELSREELYKLEKMKVNNSKWRDEFRKNFGYQHLNFQITDFNYSKYIAFKTHEAENMLKDLRNKKRMNLSNKIQYAKKNILPLLETIIGYNEPYNIPQTILVYTDALQLVRDYQAVNEIVRQVLVKFPNNSLFLSRLLDNFHLLSIKENTSKYDNEAKTVCDIIIKNNHSLSSDSSIKLLLETVAVYLIKVDMYYDCDIILKMVEKKLNLKMKNNKLVKKYLELKEKLDSVFKGMYVNEIYYLKNTFNKLNVDISS